MVEIILKKHTMCSALQYQEISKGLGIPFCNFVI